MPTVSAIMTRDPACCTPRTTLQEAARMMQECDCGEIPVVRSSDDRSPIGVITDRDIVLRAVAAGRNTLDLSVQDCMSSPALIVRETDGIEECLRLMQGQQIRRVPVVDEQGSLCGIVSQADVAEALSTRKSGELLREVSQPGASAAH